MTLPDKTTFEFHVSRGARERYGFKEALFGLTGNVVFADFAAARRFAGKMNAQREAGADPDTPAAAVRAGDLTALGLVDEILHFVVELYRRQRNPRARSGALVALEQQLGSATLEETLAAFVEFFPALAVYRAEIGVEDSLAGSTDGVPNRQVALEELLMAWLANGNPACTPYQELFDDRPLHEASGYLAAMRALEAYFKTQPGFGPGDDDLITLLRRPAIEAPGSLTEQLRWITQRWGFVAEGFGDRLVISLDVLTEEERAEWMRFHATTGGANEAGGAADSAALHGFDSSFGGSEADVERFSQDLDWMPRVVLLAKSTYVWLDQLSRHYGRPIWRLDQIPDEELDTLAARGFTGLWLIGLWERSRASQTIKQLRGNPEAVASAYSLMDYRIADDLGGDDAYRNLRDRAWARGMRLASDMVPNHMGIDSRWVIEHPDWFMARPDPPYPAYTYSGPNLSSDERVGIYLEDHYFDNTDAAVTFKRVDRWSGQESYVYHGNDGTSMPWNDTAQLDYIKAEVREAVIQTILHVARQFPIIRFDAAMTLAKKHVARLWYPEPGSAGAIPSRAEYALRKSELDAAMPVEFWREVVDRVAQEAPDTLLLAEAFWLMEGYFVRTLGMHRVYNSAFMNMMRDEKNAEYRLVIKNTLEFDAQILKRYVNFMNNPDERTSVDQFGKGDKYFGVATVMATMPGLPMFGHGQIEGFAERYGMEYRRAYLDEAPDAGLIERHEREIFPLLHRRALFAEVADFALYDFHTANGSINDDVFAYSNRRHGERTLVVFHNRFGDTRGWIRSAAVTGQSLADGLGLSAGAEDYLILRDERAGLEYLRSQRELFEHGLEMDLHAYECRLFLDLRDVRDTDGRFGRLAAWLGGRGVPSLEDALRELDMAPFHDALRAALAGGALDEALRQAATLMGVEPPAATPADAPAEAPAAGDGALGIARVVDEFVAEHDAGLAGGRWIDRWLADRILPEPELTGVALTLARRSVAPGGNGPLPVELLRDDRFRRAIGVNEHDGVTWFNRERFEHALTWLGLPRVRELSAAAVKAGYRIDELENQLVAPPNWVSTRLASTPTGKKAPKPAPKAAGRAANKTTGDGPPTKAPATKAPPTKAPARTPTKPAGK